MDMNVAMEVLIAGLYRHRERLNEATLTLVDQLRKTGEQPDESQKNVLYQAEGKLRVELGDEEYFGRS